MRTRRDLKDKNDAQVKNEVEKTNEEDEVDIDLEDPEVQAATEKIQAGYKGMRTRKDMKKKKESVKDLGDDAVIENAIPVQEGEEAVDIDLNDPEVQAATVKIQAGYKGMQTRKELKEKKEVEQTETVKEEEEVDIDLEDPEVQAATAKIQAGYKGMRTRRDMKDKKDTKDETNVGVVAKIDEEVVDIDLDQVPI